MSPAARIFSKVQRGTPLISFNLDFKGYNDVSGSPDQLVHCICNTVYSFLCVGLPLCVHLTLHLCGPQCIYIPDIRHLRDLTCEFISNTQSCIHM